MASEDGHHLLIWDGECGLCARTVCWVRRNDRAGRFATVPFQECPSPPMTPELRAAAERAVQVLTAGGDRLAGARAALFVLVEIGRWAPLARLVQHRPLIDIAELGYRLIARNRPFFGRFLFRTPC
jgi:predicted DCC family thiol-disulfide oxidoreductase YuxK